MNSDEQWLMYMWSGVFASAVGGAVAMLVLWRTNAHQAKLSDKQLAQQRRESALAREIAVRAELLELTSSFGKIRGTNRPDELSEIDRQITVKIHQWRIDLDSTGEQELRSELKNWGGFFSSVDSTIRVDDPHDDGRHYMESALKALQDTSVNFRQGVQGTVWDSRYCAELLSKVRCPALAHVHERQTEWQETDRLAREVFLEQKRRGEI